MSHQISAKGRANARPAPKPLDAALASAIQALGALIEASPDAAELRRASRVLRSLAYIATLRANASQERIAGSVVKATQHERSIERLCTELPHRGEVVMAAATPAIDAIDVPQCLRAVRLNPWRDAPTANGASVCYDVFESGTARSDQPQWFEVQPATGSDYSGGTITLANQREIKRLLTECEDPTLPDCVWCTAYGGHGTYALFVVYAALPEEIRAVLGALDDYPSVDDEALSELEFHLGSEAWASWGNAELRRALGKEIGADLEQMTDGDLFQLFRVASERMGHDWEFEQGAQAHFDFVRAARELSNVLDAPPGWLTTEQAGALEALRAFMPARENDHG